MLLNSLQITCAHPFPPPLTQQVPLFKKLLATLGMSFPLQALHWVVGVGGYTHTQFQMTDPQLLQLPLFLISCLPVSMHRNCGLSSKFANLFFSRK